ncbi:hypothetical protein MMC17_009538 [Xylographa soralifera]|nr:hypothetical protein [Xylographa soralifera]
MWLEGPENRRQILEEFQHGTSLDDNERRGVGLKLKGAKQIQSQILAEMMAIDQERAITTMKSWQKYIEVVSSRRRSEPFSDLAEFLPYRISDAGELFWFGLVTFGMGLTIPEHEMTLCKSLSFPSWSALALTNDLYSWEKERDAATKNDEPHVMNAIWILMREYSISEAQAKEVCCQKIKECVVEAVRTVETTKQNPDYSLHLKRYIEAILYSISGNLVWSIYCPRYHPEKSYDPLTLSMMAQIEEETVYSRYKLGKRQMDTYAAQ